MTDKYIQTYEGAIIERPALALDAKRCKCIGGSMCERDWGEWRCVKCGKSCDPPRRS